MCRSTGCCALVIALVLIDQTASATHNHPVSAQIFDVPLVRANAQCVAPNTAQTSLISFPACFPEVPISCALSFKSTGSTSQRGHGRVRGWVRSGGSIRVCAELWGVTVGPDGTGPAFGPPGTLDLVLRVRITDERCTTSPCTMTDVVVFTVPCDTTGRCRQCQGVTSNFNNPALASRGRAVPGPGATEAGSMMSIGIDQISVDHEGSPVFTSGLYLP